VWLITDLSRDELPTDSARELYSQRWQIELYFKRLKSILDLDELPTRDGPSTRPGFGKTLTRYARGAPRRRAFFPLGAKRRAFG